MTKENRIEEFLRTDVQFDLQWADLLIEKAQTALKDTNYKWEGSANANFICIDGTGVRLEPLHEQYTGDLFLSHDSFIVTLGSWKKKIKAGRTKS
ncbi:hypothetical protein WH96_04295 [Kiloniella spongiae]|uniref:Uncharacterized protein n=1 Tax=Kiloniella spongiae TaxID=1489064 RepID=A0A0H2MLG8_9PROT|nr:hypothetical protein [Kiloniella spongiae]KLN61582.1 hypothetical protein WH96_04295 [Kiloniella spongiae]